MIGVKLVLRKVSTVLAGRTLSLSMASALSICLNALGGIFLARALEPEMRGELAARVFLLQTIISALGLTHQEFFVQTELKAQSRSMGEAGKGGDHYVAKRLAVTLLIALSLYGSIAWVRRIAVDDFLWDALFLTGTLPLLQYSILFGVEVDTKRDALQIIRNKVLQPFLYAFLLFVAWIMGWKDGNIYLILIPISLVPTFLIACSSNFMSGWGRLQANEVYKVDRSYMAPNLFAMIQANVERVGISFAFGPRDVAAYALMTSVASPLFSVVVVPMLTKHAADLRGNGEHAFSDVIKKPLLAMAGVCLLVPTFGSYFIPLVYGDAYSFVSESIVGFSFAFFGFGIRFIVGRFLRLHGYQRYALIADFIFALLIFCATVYTKRIDQFFIVSGCSALIVVIVALFFSLKIDAKVGHHQKSK